MKIVINKCYGGFGLSKMAWEILNEIGIDDLKDQELEKVYNWSIPRDDPRLVKVVEKLGSDSWGEYAELKIVEIPDGIEWIVEESDGIEWVAETHREWR